MKLEERTQAIYQALLYNMDLALKSIKLAKDGIEDEVKDVLLSEAYKGSLEEALKNYKETDCAVSMGEYKSMINDLKLVDMAIQSKKEAVARLTNMVADREKEVLKIKSEIEVMCRQNETGKVLEFKRRPNAR